MESSPRVTFSLSPTSCVAGLCQISANFVHRRTTHVDCLRHDATSQPPPSSKCVLAHQQNTETSPFGPPQPRRCASQTCCRHVRFFLAVAFLLLLTFEICSGRGVGPIRSRPLRGGLTSRSGPKKPKTAEELDKELDAFMGDSDTVVPVAEAQGSVETPAQDVDMA